MAEKGFTLIELLVVLVIMAGLAAVAISRLSGPASGLSIEAAARELVAGLREARSEAIARNREVEFVLDLRSGFFTVGRDGRRNGLSPEIAISMVTARSEQLEDAVGSIRFYPDGSSTGGEIRIEHEAHDYLVAVEWLTGRVSILQ